MVCAAGVTAVRRAGGKDMKVGDRITVYAGGVREDAFAEKGNGAEKKGEAGKEAKTVYAGDVLGSFDLKSRIEQRKGMAQNQAGKIIRDAWNGDKVLDRELEELDRRTAELRQTIREQLGTIHGAAEQKEGLREVYGISDEEWELMERCGKTLSGGGGLTEEEKEQYRQLTEREWYGEYRRRASELDMVISEGWKGIARAKGKVLEQDIIARRIHEERLKIHPMLDAGRKAEDVIAAASEDVIGMVVDDAKEQMDSLQEEREEKAETIREEKENREEILEERREEEEELEELMEDVPLEQPQEGGSGPQMRQQLMDIQNEIEAEVQKQVLEIQNQVNSSVETLKSLIVDVKI